MQLGRGQLVPAKLSTRVNALKLDPKQPAVNPHQTVMPKPVGNPFKILAPLRLCAFALKFYCMDTAKMVLTRIFHSVLESEAKRP